jgi:DNA-binding transcriptional regulator GbsR (MarR family)
VFSNPDVLNGMLNLAKKNLTKGEVKNIFSTQNDGFSFMWQQNYEN